MFKLLRRSLTILAFTTAPAFAQAVPSSEASPVAIACAYQPTLPSLTSGTFGYVQCDSAGRLIISGGTSGNAAAANPYPGSDYSNTAGQTTTNAILGTPSDSPWSGSGSATLAAIDKAIYAKLAGTLNITGTITANLGTLNGAALDASVQAVKTTLGNPFQAGGNIGNTAFGANQGTPAAASSAWPVAPVVGGSAVASGNPLPVTVGNFPATQPVSAASLPLPTGAATASGQNIAAAGTSAPAGGVGVQGVAGGVPFPKLAIQTYVDQSGASIAASTTTTGTIRTVGSTWSRFSIAVHTNQAGTLTAQGCADSACGIALTMASQTVPAGGGDYIIPATAIFSPYVRYVYANGTTAATAVTILSSLTAN